MDKGKTQKSMTTSPCLSSNPTPTHQIKRKGKKRRKWVCTQTDQIKPASSWSMTSASSSDDVQPDRWDLFLLEEATSFNALRIASACTASPLPSSKLPRIGDKDPTTSTKSAKVRTTNKLAQI